MCDDKQQEQHITILSYVRLKYLQVYKSDLRDKA
jgi:hypothetical protein